MDLKPISVSRSRSTRSLVYVAAGLLAGWAAAASAAPGPSPADAKAVQGPPERIPAKPSRPAPSKDIGDDGGTRALPQNVLTPLNVSALLQEDALNASWRAEKVQRMAVERRLQLASYDGIFKMGTHGRLWSAELRSSDALALRLHFSDVRLPRGAVLAVISDGAGYEQISWIEPEFGAGAWSDYLVGDLIRIEYYAPHGSYRQGDLSLPFRIDSLHHFYRDPLADPYISRGAGSCHNDVTCAPDWASTARAVARITFIKGNASYLCTGQLLNAQNSDLTPYLLTANHCISTGAVAATAQFFWFYQTDTCNGLPPEVGLVPTSSGASLLATGAASDFTLLMVEGGLPADTTWVGWTSAAVTNGTPSTSIHHPSGDYKRISFGTKASNTTCGGANHVRINWTDGPTEGGSSGGGVYRNDSKQLYGQLHCGGSACGSETNDDYGAFSATYPSISTLLTGGGDDTSEQNDSCGLAKVVTAGTLTNRVIKSTDPDWYRISVPAGKKLTVTATFLHNNGDLDLALYGTCGGGALSISDSVNNSESVTVTNTSGAAKSYFWNPFLYSDTRNTYSITTTIQ